MAERQCWKCKTWHTHLTERPKLRCECGAWMGTGGRGATRDQQAKVEMDLIDAATIPEPSMNDGSAK